MSEPETDNDVLLRRANPPATVHLGEYLSVWWMAESSTGATRMTVTSVLGEDDVVRERWRWDDTTNTWAFALDRDVVPDERRTIGGLDPDRRDGTGGRLVFAVTGGPLDDTWQDLPLDEYGKPPLVLRVARDDGTCHRWVREELATIDGGFAYYLEG